MEGLGKRLKEIRGKTSREQFAAKLHIHPNTYRNYELGERSPDSVFLISVCGVFGVDPGWLLTGQGSMHGGEDSAEYPPLFPGEEDNYLGLPPSEDCRFDPERYNSDEFYKSVVDTQRQLVELLYQFQLNQFGENEEKQVKSEVDSTLKRLVALNKALKKLKAKPFKYKDEADKFPKFSSDRAFFIWKKGCKDVGTPEAFDQDVLKIFDHYKNQRLTDSELYDNAVRWARAHITVIKKVDRRNGHK